VYAQNIGQFSHTAQVAVVYADPVVAELSTVMPYWSVFVQQIISWLF
jgi:hypothetical protein